MPKNIPSIDDLFQAAQDNILGEPTLFERILSLKQYLLQFLGLPCTVKGTECLLTIDLIKAHIQFIYQDNSLEVQAMLAKIFCHDVVISDLLSQHNEVTEAQLQMFAGSEETTQLLTKSSEQKTSADLPTALSDVEEEALKVLKQPFYAKTITGFGQVNAWQEVTTAMTLRNKAEKPHLRNPTELMRRPFRVRLNSRTQRHEVHDNRNKADGLHQIEKERRKMGGWAPLPPHQSFTYYEPEDPNFRPIHFVPTSLGETQKMEVFGLRIKVEGTFINRVIISDQGTYFVFYGFYSRSEAQQYADELNQPNSPWGKSLEDLKQRQSQNSYNEVMARGQWSCDGSSQLLLYPPYSLSGKYAAILARLDLERHLKAHQNVYRDPPYNWTEKYHVPISYWRNDDQCRLYSLSQQLRDLANPPQNERERVLQTAIFYMQHPGHQKTTQAITALKPLFQELLNDDPKTLCNIFGLLTWKSLNLIDFYCELITGLPEVTLVTFINSINLQIDQRGDLIVLGILKYAFILKGNDEALKALLMAESARKGLVIGFCLACIKGHLDIVNAILDSALKLQDKGETLKSLLIGVDSTSPNKTGFYWACFYGHLDIVNVILDLAFKFQDKGETLKTFFENINSGCFFIAYKNRHLQIVKAILASTSKLQDNGETLKAMVTASSPFVAFELCRSSENDRLDSLKTIFHQAVQTFGGIDKREALNLVKSYIGPSLSDCCIPRTKTILKEVALQLLAADAKAQKNALSILEQTLYCGQRAIFLGELHKIYQEQPINLNRVKSIYGHHAGFFSLTRYKINTGYIKKDKLVDTLFERAQSHLDGASMMTLLAVPSPLRK